jgi:uncharacterized protein (TIGR00730 family)
MRLKWICVFCGAKVGTAQRYSSQVVDFGQTLVRNGMGLVYGGASVGLMGILADTVLAAGGEAIGVIPQGLLEKEIAHERLTRRIITSSLAERKARMLELSDAFVTLPGGAGTLDELSELWTAALLGLHTKPIGILNADGYFDLLLKFFDQTVSAGFVSAAARDLLHVRSTAQELLDQLVGAARAV